MRLALKEAERAADRGDVPIGAVIVKDGELVAAACNERELRKDAAAHAEVLAIREAGAKLGGWRLLGTTIYITLEPCAMCAGATIWSRIPRVVYGAPDAKSGAAGSTVDLYANRKLNHHSECVGGLLAEDSILLLQAFFGDRR